jgi:stress-induced morphogen
MITPEEIRQMLLTQMPGSRVDVSDMRGTGDHFEIEVASPAFSGKSLIEQHRMVFAVLAPEMDRRIHAVQLKTKTL